MNKILYTLSIVTAIIIAGYCTYVAGPALRYAEGWCTFFYDHQYVDAVGLETAARAFLLQFFASPSIGIAVMCCLSLAIMSIVCMLLFLCRIKSKAFICAVAVVASVASCLSIEGWLAQISIPSLIFQSEGTVGNLRFIEGSCMTREEKWDDIISYYKQYSPVNNQLHLNVLNMALAEKGELAQHLLDEPCSDIRSIYVNEIPNYLIAAHLSDVYYSMGHIAQSQRYAFEANEKLYNYSPRLLQRLVSTNIIYGQYCVARKYLILLSHTLYYREWAQRILLSITMLEHGGKSDDALVTEILKKRQCLFDNDRFSGIKGLDDDLLHVARNTRCTQQCRTTLNYLGSLYILAGYRQEFVDMVEEFGGSNDLPTPLPKYFDSYFNHLKPQD